jgi:hypothetical protein
MVSDLFYPIRLQIKFLTIPIGVSFLFSATAFVLALLIRQRPLDGPRA